MDTLAIRPPDRPPSPPVIDQAATAPERGARVPAAPGDRIDLTQHRRSFVDRAYESLVAYTDPPPLYRPYYTQTELMLHRLIRVGFATSFARAASTTARGYFRAREASPGAEFAAFRSEQHLLAPYINAACLIGGMALERRIAARVAASNAWDIPVPPRH